MIQLPEGFISWAYVDIRHDRLVLHLHNDAHQFFTQVHLLDKIKSLDDHLQEFAQKDFSDQMAYSIIPATMETMAVLAPIDQNWAPAPVPDEQIIPVAMYRALKGLPQ